MALPIYGLVSFAASETDARARSKQMRTGAAAISGRGCVNYQGLASILRLTQGEGRRPTFPATNGAELGIEVGDVHYSFLSLEQRV